MTPTRCFGLGMLILSAALVGCPDSSKKAEKDGGKKIVVTKEDDHGPHGKGPNGGTVFDLGKFHAEFTVDHAKKECTLLILGTDEKTIQEIAAKDLTVSTKETKTKEGKTVPPMTIKMAAANEKDGKASKYVGTDPGLGNVADFEGVVQGEINGRPSKGNFKEE
jgi:hypothetical protein